MSNKTKVISIRFLPYHAELLSAVCASREDKSDFVRRAVLRELAELSFLDGDARKALGVKDE